jgi:hypothetical protein
VPITAAINEGTERNEHRFGILEFNEIFDVRLTKFDANQILVDKISQQFQVQTNLFTR